MRGPLSREEMAAVVAHDIPSGAYVNLGIGLPTGVSNYIHRDKAVTLHTENGMLGMGPVAELDQIDPDLLNAGKMPVTEQLGASYFHQADSFGIMRGGHLDICVLGAFQVSVTGDLANWDTGKEGAVPAVGGAMDLAVGAKQVFVIMDLFSRDGSCKLVEECSYPLTAMSCVNTIYTDYAVFDIRGSELSVRETFGTISLERLSAITGLSLTAGL